MSVTIALVDDHVLLRNGLANLLKDLEYEVIFQADNGKEFIEKLSVKQLPHLVLMDINMPELDGFETTLWLKSNHPGVKVLALSMYDDENSIVRMLRNGAKGYILKDCDPPELKAAINGILTKGFYYSELVTGKLIYTVSHSYDNGSLLATTAAGLSTKELEFLKLSCTELTYKEIADLMHLSPRTIDGYRDALFEKLGLKSRVGLVLFAIKHSIVQL